MAKYDFTPEDVEYEVRHLAATRPDFVYTEQEGRDGTSGGCGYLGREQGSTEGEGCIVGQALQRLGVTETDLFDCEGASASSVVWRLTNDGPRAPEALNEPRVRWVDYVQRAQDEGIPWADAVCKSDFIRFNRIN